MRPDDACLLDMLLSARDAVAFVNSPYEEPERPRDRHRLDATRRLAYDPPRRVSRNRSESDSQPTLRLLDRGEP